MKLRSFIATNRAYATSESQRDMWRAIGALEKRTRHLKRVPPFPKKLDAFWDADPPKAAVSDEECVLVPVSVLDDARRYNLKNELNKLYARLHDETNLKSWEYIALLDAIQFVCDVMNEKNDRP